MVAVRAHLRLSAIHARYRVLWADGQKDLIAVVAHQTTKIAHLQEDVQQVRAQLSRTADDVAQSLRHVAVVPYDASGDMSDQPSFAVAIVDDHADGLVISSIHARGESRTYAKAVLGGLSHFTLTPEEHEAVAVARTRKGST